MGVISAGFNNGGIRSGTHPFVDPVVDIVDEDEMAFCDTTHFSRPEKSHSSWIFGFLPVSKEWPGRIVDT